MTVTDLHLPGVKRIVPKRFGDHRGYFAEMYSRARFAELGLDAAFVQDNESLSATLGTIRGLHFQRPPHAQAKLIRCVLGKLLDVAVDIRRGSPTFGQHVAEVLSADNGHQLYIPKGFAHGFATLTPDCLVQYKVDDVYAPDCDAGLAFDDPALDIDWQVDPATATLSDKDRKHPTLAELDSPFVYEEPA